MVDDLSQQVDSCFQGNWAPSLCRLIEDQFTEVVSVVSCCSSDPLNLD